MGKVAGVNQGRFDTSRKIHLTSSLSPLQVDILKKLGFREVRDASFTQGRGISYMVYNITGESNKHYILWNLIFDEAKKYTDMVEYHLTVLADVAFGLENFSWVGVEVEATRKTAKQLRPKLKMLKDHYDDWFFVVTDYDKLEHYQQFGPTYTRTQARDIIASYFKPGYVLESRTKLY